MLQKTGRVDFANTLRGFAALAVMLGHYCGVFWYNQSFIASLINAAPPQYIHIIPQYISWLNKLPFVNWGAYGVALFFIISGFVIPFSLSRMTGIGFCFNRFFRIVPTYVVGFSISLLAIWANSKYFSTNWPFSLSEILFHYMPGLRDIMNSRHIDGIVWTLEIEVKFYLICAMFIVWFRQASMKVFLVPVALFLLSIWLYFATGHWANTSTALYRYAVAYTFPIQCLIFMFIGVAFHYLFMRKIAAEKVIFVIMGMFAMFCILWQLPPHNASFSVAWSYAFALLTFTFAYNYPALFKANVVFDFLADISYPLYIIHGLMGYVILRLLLDKGIKPWVTIIIVISAAMFLAWLIHKYVEIPFQTFSKKLANKGNFNRNSAYTLQNISCIIDHFSL